MGYEKRKGPTYKYPVRFDPFREAHTHPKQQQRSKINSILRDWLPSPLALTLGRVTHTQTPRNKSTSLQTFHRRERERVNNINNNNKCLVETPPLVHEKQPPESSPPSSPPPVSYAVPSKTPSTTIRNKWI